MRLLIALLAIAFAVLQFRLWLSEGGIREVWRLDDQVARRTEENGRLAERNSALEAEVQDLKKGLAAAEERARSELGMVLPEERFYQIMPFPPAEAADRATAVDAPWPGALTRAAAGGVPGAKPSEAGDSDTSIVEGLPSVPSEETLDDALGTKAAVSGE